MEAAVEVIPTQTKLLAISHPAETGRPLSLHDAGQYAVEPVSVTACTVGWDTFGANRSQEKKCLEY